MSHPHGDLRIAVLSRYGGLLPHITECMQRALAGLGVSVLHVLPESDDPAYASTFVEETIARLKAFSPDYAFFIGLNGFIGLEEPEHVLHMLGIPYVIFFFDFSLAFRQYLERFRQTYLEAVFVWDRSYVGTLQGYGVTNVHYLPLGTDPDYFSRPPGDGEEMDLSFVGIVVGNRMIEDLRSSLPDSLRERAEELIRKKLNDADFNIYAESCLSDPLVQQHMVDFYSYVNYRYFTYYRKRILYELAGHIPLHVFGPREWNESRRDGVAVHPGVDFRTGLAGVFRRTRVNLNFSGAQLATSVNQRVFDCFGTGNFLLSDYRQDLKSLFPGQEIPCFTSRRDLVEKARFYLEHPEERNRIAREVQQTVLRQHTWRHRMESVLEALRPS